MIWALRNLEALGELIKSIVNLVVTLIRSLFDFISNLPVFFDIITGSFSAIPSFILPFASISLTISVIFIILGRGKSN